MKCSGISEAEHVNLPVHRDIMKLKVHFLSRIDQNQIRIWNDDKIPCCFPTLSQLTQIDIPSLNLQKKNASCQMEGFQNN